MTPKIISYSPKIQNLNTNFVLLQCLFALKPLKLFKYSV